MDLKKKLYLQQMVTTQNKSLLEKYKINIIVFLFALFIFFLAINELYQCPSSFFFGIPCPLCGITRAIISVFRFDFDSAFYYHALWPIVVFGVPLYFFFIMNNKKITKKNKNIIFIFVSILFLGYFIIRHITSSPIVQIDFSKSLVYFIIKKLFSLF